MDCSEFLTGYSDFRDGLLGLAGAAAYERHLERCASCARYDRVVREGTELIRALPGAEASRDFMPRLQHRLYHVDDGIPYLAGRFGGSAALVGVAAVGLLALFWLPFATRIPLEVELPAVAVEAPAVEEPDPVPMLFRQGPFIEAAYVAPEPSPPLESARDWPPMRDDRTHPFDLLKTASAAASPAGP